MNSNQKPKIIIVGAGFGGLFAAREFRKQDVDVLIIDRLNYHTFTPLLYQVATSALDPGEIAYPIRSIFGQDPNIQCMLGEVTSLHPADQYLAVDIGGESREESYDYLLLATGSQPGYFGNNQFREHSFDLRTLDDAVGLRNHILRCFETALWTGDPDLREALTNFVIIGGGPTGLETAGALFELFNHTFEGEYKSPDRIQARVHLVEMAPQLLGTYPDTLQEAALDQITNLGVNVILNNGVKDIQEDYVVLQDGLKIPSQTVIWAAGVTGSSPAGLNQLGKNHNNQIEIEPDLRAADYQNIFAVGDTAYLPREGQEPYPMMIPVAQQQGILAAQNILRDIQGQTRKNFEYHDRGIMATIGRSRAVAWIFNRIPLSGFPAWLAWLLLHLMTLIGFRNKLVVFINWVWNYFTYDRSVRIILD